MSSVFLAIKKFFVNEFSADSSHNIVLQTEHLTEELIHDIQKILPFAEKEILPIIEKEILPIIEKEIIPLLETVIINAVSPELSQLITAPIVESLIDTIVNKTVSLV